MKMSEGNFETNTLDNNGIKYCGFNNYVSFDIDRDKNYRFGIWLDHGNEFISQVTGYIMDDCIEIIVDAAEKDSESFFWDICDYFDHDAVISFERINNCYVLKIIMTQQTGDELYKMFENILLKNKIK